MKHFILISLLVTFISCGKSFYNESLSQEHYKVAILLPNVKIDSDYNINDDIDNVRKTLQQIIVKQLQVVNHKLTFELVPYEKDADSLRRLLVDEEFNAFLTCEYECKKIGNNWLSTGVFLVTGSFSDTEEYELQMEIIEVNTDKILWKYSTEVTTSLSTYKDTFKGFMIHVKRSLKSFG